MNERMPRFPLMLLPIMGNNLSSTKANVGVKTVCRLSMHSRYSRYFENRGAMIQSGMVDHKAEAAMLQESLI